MPIAQLITRAPRRFARRFINVLRMYQLRHSISRDDHEIEGLTTLRADAHSRLTDVRIERDRKARRLHRLMNEA